MKNEPKQALLRTSASVTDRAPSSMLRTIYDHLKVLSFGKKLKPYYAELLTLFPEEQKKRIWNEFLKAHHDFRDSVQIPSIVAGFSAIIMQAVAFSLCSGATASLIVTPFVITYYVVMEAALSNKLKRSNVSKMEHFLKNRSEPIDSDNVV